MDGIHFVIAAGATGCAYAAPSPVAAAVGFRPIAPGGRQPTLPDPGTQSPYRDKIIAMTELIFLVEEAPEGGYTARALGQSIFTEADDVTALEANVRDAVRCHFDEGSLPRIIRLHFTREEVITIWDCLRDVAGDDLARQLGRFGYIVTRQTGSHMRLTTSQPDEHHVTIPRHNSLRLGTLRAILDDVAAHLGITRDDLLAQLFGWATNQKIIVNATIQPSLSPNTRWDQHETTAPARLFMLPNLHQLWTRRPFACSMQ